VQSVVSQSGACNPLFLRVVRAIRCFSCSEALLKRLASLTPTFLNQKLGFLKQMLGFFSNKCGKPSLALSHVRVWEPRPLVHNK
jgi:hypothetical protein